MNTKVAKKNNKGFTLIELIVVIAIIAVLAAILAPQYLRYVEKSRISADASTANEIKNATQTACANEDVFTELDQGGANVQWDKDGKVYANSKSATAKGASAISKTDTDKLGKELASTLTDIPKMKSKKWQSTFDTTNYTVTIEVDTANSSVTIKDNAPKS